MENTKDKKNPKTPPQIPPSPQHTVVGLNCFNATSKLSNANWVTNLSEDVVVNTGDSIFVKNCYVDTRLQTSQNILIDEDTTIEMEFWFYYVNRGGTNSPSTYQDYGSVFAPYDTSGACIQQPIYSGQNPYIKQQVRANEVGQSLVKIPAIDATGAGYPFAGVFAPFNLPFTVIDANIAGQETIENLAEMTETIYYSPNNFPLPSSAGTSYLNSLTKDQLRTNPMGFIMPQGINAGDGMPYILKMAAPEILPPPAVPVPFPSFSIYWDVNNNVLVDTFSAKGTWSAQPSPVSLPSPYLQQWTTNNPGQFQQQLNIGISWDITTGNYYLVEGLVIANGIAVGQTFIIKGSAFGLSDGLNDCILTVNLVVPVNPPPVPAGSGYPASPPLSAVNFSVVGTTASFAPASPLYKPVAKLVPFTKKWTMLIPAGSYTPDYLAEFISRGMAAQKQKIQRAYQPTGTSAPVLNTLITPTQLINSQVAGFNSGPIYANNDFDPGAQLPIMSLTDDTGAFFDTNYQPALYYASKNPKSYPSPPAIPMNPPFSPDFVNPGSKDRDDMSFIFRPNAFLSRFGLQQTDITNSVDIGTNAWFGTNATEIPVACARLTLNDMNYQIYNEMPAFAPGSYDPNIDMMYCPFLSDVNSPFYWMSESGFNPANPPLNVTGSTANSTPPDMNYGIRPIYSTMANQFTQYDKNNDWVFEEATGTYYNGFAGTPDVSTPLVGTTQMSLSYNIESSGLFSLNYLHNPIYNKPDPDTNQTQESVGKYPSAYAFGPVPSIVTQGYVQCDRQSGIILKSMNSYTKSGQSAGFWEKLGFNVNEIIAPQDADGNPVLDYQNFKKRTTGAFSGTANVYNPAYNVRGNSEICYASDVDTANFGGWYGVLTEIGEFASVTNNLSFIKNFNSIFYTVSPGQTTAIYAETPSLNSNDCGHVLIELQAWSLPFISETDYKEVKAIVSNYFVSANSFVSQIGPESFQYYHIGPPMTISSIKCRILNPKTLDELPLTGPNSSIYVQFVQQPTETNIITYNAL